MKLNEIPLIGGFYKDEDRDWSVQDCVNYLPTVAETAGTRTQTMLRTAPGLRPFVRVPGAGPCRGVYNCEGRLFAVLGQALYLIGADGIAVPIGKIPGIQKVQFAHNQATSSGQNQLVIGNGQAGYIYNTKTEEFKRITDEGFIGGISPTFVDSYIVWVSTNRLYMLNSSVADAAEYNTLDQFQSEYSPDKLVCTIASSSELVAMSERSIEFFQNVGANEQPFRSKGISIDLGAASRWGAVICDFSLFFLASDGTFRRIDNYNATRVSTGPVEQAIRDLDWSQAQAYVWEEGRYKVVYWTFPDGYTFGWDIANGMWHRRVSYGLNRWRVSSTARWNGKNIAGDFQRGDLWIVDSNYFLEGDQEYDCEITGPYIHGDGNLVKMPRMDLIMQTGQEDTVAAEFPDQPDAPTISGSAPDGLRNQPYSGYTYTINGEQPPLVVTVSGGALPPGLTISAEGILSGTPTTFGNYAFTLRVTDRYGLWTELSDSIGVVTQVLALGTISGVTKAVTRRNLTGTWSNVNSGAAAGAPYLMGVASERFLAWIAGAAYYSDDNGGIWTQSATVIDSSGGNRAGDSHSGVVVLGGSGVCYVSTNNGTTYTARTAPSSFLQAAVIVKSGANAGRIMMINSSATANNAYSDNQGVSFTNCPAHGVSRSSGGSSASDLNFQYIGGNVTAGGKPRIAVMQNGATLVRNLTLTGAANGIVSSILSYQMGSATRLLMGTSTGELWASDDAGASATRLPFTSAGSVSGIVFDGARLIVGTATGTNMIQVSTNNGATWETEANPSSGGITVLAGLP